MKFTKLLKNIFTIKSLALLMCLLLILSVIPLLVIGQYNIPSNDDWGNATPAYILWHENHSLGQLLAVSIDWAVSFYKTWSGQYSIVLISLMSPFVMDNYWVIGYITILPLGFCSIFYIIGKFAEWRTLEEKKPAKSG